MGPQDFAAIATLSTFRVALNESPSPRLQFLLDRLDELYGFKLAVNGHAVLGQVAPGQDGNLVNPVLPLQIASISVVFKDPGRCHVRVSAIDDERAVLKEATGIRRRSMRRVQRLPAQPQINGELPAVMRGMCEATRQNPGPRTGDVEERGGLLELESDRRAGDGLRSQHQYVWSR
jgi:hypothetical protein